MKRLLAALLLFFAWATPPEGGIPDLDASIWVGLFAPAGAEAIGTTPAEFLARIKNDAVRYRRVVEQAGVKPG
jgi:tripartite-type tricarboxylate transporter receptor subunit TctC